MRVVIAINCLMAAMICLGAVRLWLWRRELQRFNTWLGRDDMSPEQLGVTLMLQRAQFAETRLELARLQLRSRQAKQVFRLLQLVRMLLFYTLRLGKTRPRRLKK